MNLYKKIIEIRKNNNLTQEEFAEKLKVSRQTVSNWENNKCYPDIETLILISENFNISLDNLLKEDKKMIKDIDRKIKWNRKLIYGICFLFIIILISFSVIYLKNNVIMKVEANNIKLEKSIKNLINVPKDYRLISLSTDKINIKELVIGEKIDIYVKYNNKIILNKPFITNATIIKYVDHYGKIAEELEDVSEVLIAISDDAFNALTKVKVLDLEIIIKNNPSDEELKVNSDVLDYIVSI